MKKKFIIVLLSLVCTFCLVLGLTACNKGTSGGTTDVGQNTEQSGDTEQGDTEQGDTEHGGETTHTHTEGEAVKENEVAATCVTEGFYDSVVYCTICGAELSREMVTTEATGVHTYNGSWTCSVCGYFEFTVSEGLLYTLSSDGESYTLSGIGTCTDSNIVIPYTYNGLPVTAIAASAFRYKTQLTSIIIPDSVTSIGEHAFDDCTSLTSITIPDSVTSIDEYAFRSCTSLTSITIPDSVTSIGDTAFSYCTSLTSINVCLGNVVYKSIDGNLYSYDGAILIQYAIGKTDTSFTISSNVNSIMERAFSCCTALKSVTFENTSGWYMQYSSINRKVDVSDDSKNVTYLTYTYDDYYWYRSED